MELVDRMTMTVMLKLVIDQKGDAELHRCQNTVQRDVGGKLATMREEEGKCTEAAFAAYSIEN